MLRSPVRAAALLVLSWLASGCYYGHLASGQTRLWLAREPVEALIRAPATPRALREKLRLAQAVRAYARELGLDVGGQYTSYVAWPGDRIITALVATPPGSIEPHRFRFPIVGRVPYKGFFSRERADREAQALRARGFDVCLSAVPAYSTLGWLDDPLTTPLLAGPPLALVDTLLHELVHATVYVTGDAALGESAATFVGQQAAIAFVEAHGIPGDPRGRAAQARAQRDRVDDARAIARELLRLRAAIAAAYARARERPPKAEALARERAALEAQARARLAALPLRSGDPARLARTARLGDACLALRGTYTADLDAHAAVLEAEGGDLRRFVARLREAAHAPDPRARLFGAAAPN